jgi:hypothetical protein
MLVCLSIEEGRKYDYSARKIFNLEISRKEVFLSLIIKGITC